MIIKHAIIGGVILVLATLYLSIIIRGPNGVIVNLVDISTASEVCNRHDGAINYSIYSSLFRGAARAEAILVTCGDLTHKAYFIDDKKLSTN